MCITSRFGSSLSGASVLYRSLGIFIHVMWHSLFFNFNKLHSNFIQMILNCSFSTTRTETELELKGAEETIEVVTEEIEKEQVHLNTIFYF